MRREPSLPRPSRKREIVDAALACYAERGYAATRMATIAERAGVSEAAIYRHFESIEELGAQLYLEFFTLYSSRLAAAIAGETRVESQLRAIVCESLSLFRAHPDAFVFAL